MHFNRHSALADRHAFLSPSGKSWVNYDLDKLERRFHTIQAARRGVELHEYAQMAIRLRQRAPEAPTTLNMYINDAIGYRLVPEQSLYFSDRCFGTADACGFRDGVFRVFDLKTGEIVADITQLKIYCAIFCHEYKFNPYDITMEMRIYQNDDVVIETADPTEILQIMTTIVEFDKHLQILESTAL